MNTQLLGALASNKNKPFAFGTIPSLIKMRTDLVSSGQYKLGELKIINRKRLKKCAQFN